jgi:hypothetical protein
VREGVQLTLLIGPGVPVPAPRGVIDALQSVQVMTSAGDFQSGFELKFGLPKEAHPIAQYLGLAGPTLPVIRTIIVATVNGTPIVLIDGVVTHHEVGQGGGNGAVLTVKGKDLSALMDLIELSGIPYPAMPRFARAALILAKYAAFGLVPKVIPPVMESPALPIERIPVHRGTDLEYLRWMAGEVGYVFYLEPGPVPGTSFAYWGPDIKTGVPQPALSTDFDAHTNVEELSFSFDKEADVLPLVFVQNRESKAPIAIPIPDITPLNPPLGLLRPMPPRMVLLGDTAHLDPVEAVMHGLAFASRNAESLTGQGSLDVVRYGRPLKARGLVGVRGAGLPFDGLYYVNSVTHTLKRGEYKQSFTLTRNGLFPTVPAVPV